MDDTENTLEKFEIMVEDAICSVRDNNEVVFFKFSKSKVDATLELMSIKGTVAMAISHYCDFLEYKSRK